MPQDGEIEAHDMDGWDFPFVERQSRGCSGAGCVLIKYMILGLLLLNSAYYVITGRLYDGLDSIAWLGLLFSFELEARYLDQSISVRLVPLNRAFRFLAIVLITMAYGGFIRESAWLDVMNSVLWLIAVILLECESRLPQLVSRFPLTFKLMGAGVLLSLIGLSLFWAHQGEWFDAYDALIWIIALVIIDLDFLKRTTWQIPKSHVPP